jgi:hypothetical protein
MAIHGSTCYFNLDTSGGSPTDRSSDVQSLDFSLDQAIHDTTTFGNSAHTKTVGLKDSKFTVTFISSTTVLGYLNALYTAQTPGTTSTWSWIIGPRGSTGGYEKYSGEAVLASLPVPAVVDNIEVITAQFEGTGAVTIGTF